jgi:hypothetical protein
VAQSIRTKGWHGSEFLRAEHGGDQIEEEEHGDQADYQIFHGRRR